MPQVRATASALIPAAPEIVYGIIADFRSGRPAVLPPSFRTSRVLEGMAELRPLAAAAVPAGGRA